jgi:hypothetical protein
MAISVDRRAYEVVCREGPPARTEHDHLLLIHAGHYRALLDACRRGGTVPYETEGVNLGCY